MANVVLAFAAAELIQQGTNGFPQRVERTGLGFAQQSLQLGEYLFDRVVIRTVGRQLAQRRTGALNRLTYPGHFV